MPHEFGPIVFLIGAGASADAGMPLVSCLTTEIREQLRLLPDINGEIRPEFPKLFDAIAHEDQEVLTNYERFFEWISLINRSQVDPFRKLIRFDLDQYLLDAAPFLAWSIKKPIWKFFSLRHNCSTYQPGYFSKLGGFLPERSRLKVFTTNYDLCIEDACRACGIEVVTGFHPRTGQWSPSLFRGRSPGINLYKLHGSLNWGLSDNLTDLQNRPLIESYPANWDKEPELILGPGSKLQPDDPYASLYAEFHKAIRTAKVCVAIGYSFRDEHIRQPIQQANSRGMIVIDVNPSPVGWSFSRSIKLKMGARQAFDDEEISRAIAGLHHGHS